MAGKISFAGICSCMLLLTAQAVAQRPSDSAIRAAAINHAVKDYRSYVTLAAPLYSGPKYTEYSPLVEKGQPFFMNTSYHNGTILYDHILYDRVQLKYDVLTNRVIVADPEGISKLCPDYNKIETFSILDHSFIKLTSDKNVPSAPSPGFYEVVFTNNSNLTILKKESKIMRQDLSASVVTRYILTSVDYYFKKGNTYHSINKRNQLIDLLKDKKKEVQEFIRNKNLDFDDDKDNAIKSTLMYYETLVKS